MRIVFVIFFLLLSACGTREGVETFHLITLRQKDSVSGSSFLGIGNMGYSAYYFYYIDKGNGAFQADWIRADKATVFEENRNDAVLIHKYCDAALATPLEGFHSCEGQPMDVYEFHVPKGTIVRGYSL